MSLGTNKFDFQSVNWMWNESSKLYNVSHFVAVYTKPFGFLLGEVGVEEKA